ncbi:Domain of unknown function DUF4806 [Cinara cedri]|uniref:DUF4806 domain-containing protein n=1 Tax=Cinara cedri TaxID=506608 RepID=A0A5E4N4S0_9HEMI|nr:Domain of unknown function DUF4806 [Cinara cedri]
MEWRGDNEQTARPTSTIRYHADKPSWAIGYFISANEGLNKNDTLSYSIVPTHWVVFQQDGLVCKWPNEKSINVANLVKNSIHLNEDYSLYHFKLANNRYYDSLEEANEQLLEMFGLLDSESMHSLIKNKGEDRTISLQDHNMEQYTIKDVTRVNSISNQNVGSLRGNLNDATFSCPTQRMNQFGNDNMMGNVNFLPNPTSKVPLRTETCIRFEKDKSIQNNLHPESLQGEVLTLNSAPKPIFQPSKIEWDTMKSELKDIKSELMANRIIRDQLWNKLDSLQKEITNLKSNATIFTTQDPMDKLFLHLLPISSVEKLNHCENMLKDTAIKDKLINMFSAIGGDNEKNHVRRILNSLFTKSFAIRCSWTGRGSRKNISYVKIQGRLIIQIMQSVIINLHKCSDSEFEYIVQLWFTHARTHFHEQDQHSLT